MLPGLSCAVRSPGTFAVLEVGAKPKQGTECVSLRGSRTCWHSMSPEIWGQAGPHAPERPSASTCCSPARDRPVGCKDAESGRCIDPVPSTGTERGIPIWAKNPDLSSLTTPPAKRPAPAAPMVGVLGRAAPCGAQPSWDGGRRLLFWELDRCPGQEAAAVQLILGPCKAAPAPAHSVPASAGTATSFACHPPRGTAALTDPPSAADPPPEDNSLE